MRIITTALLLLLFIPAAAHADRWHRWHHRHWGWNRWHRWEMIDDDAPAPTFGAIAFSPTTGRYGTSWNRLSAEGAQQAAVLACGVGDCTSRVTEQAEFAVLVRGSAGMTTAWNPDLAAAQQAALTSCSTQSTDCHVIATTHD